MNKKEKSILEEIREDIQEIKELLKNPRRLLDGEKPKRLFNPNDPATEGQIWKIKDLGLEVPNIKDLTKGEAHKIISEKLKEIKSQGSSEDEKYPNY